MMVPSDADLVFHHVGVACVDIHAEAAHLASLGYSFEGPEFTDRLQGVRGIFLTGQAPRLELLESLSDGDGGMLGPWLRHEIKLYHLAYETGSLPGAIDRLRRERAKVVVAPVPAVAFGGREIAFVMLPNTMLVELIARDDR